LAKNISEEEVRQAVAEVKHPMIDRTLIELGMIKGITVSNDGASLALLLPSLNIPLKDSLVNSVREAVMKLGLKVTINIEQMNQEEVQSFLVMEKEGWKGHM